MSLDISLVCPHCESTLHEDNITHNLGEMADAAGIYRAMWRPEEIGIAQADALIEPLERGITALKAESARFKALNPANGWGDYEGLLAAAERYLAACREHPQARVRARR